MTDSNAPEPTPRDGPLVSCIMPTANRRRFIPLAVNAFLRQDYPHRELIVIDDGTDAVCDLMPDDERIRYVRLDERASVGAKRNRACEMARGGLIAHWDDDDWSAPHRLRVQVEGLHQTERSVCGLDRLIFCHPTLQKAWLYRYPRTARPWVAGGTMLYRRDVWARHPFEDVSDGEDTRFVWAMPGDRIHIVDGVNLYVARVHDGNTSPKHIHTARWHPHPLADVRATLGDDWAVFAGTAPPPLETAGDGLAESVPRRASVRLRPSARSADASFDAHPCVTVTIPYYRCKAHIRKAVSSILGQTYARLRLVVVNDGDPDPPWDVLDDIKDSRLVRVDLTANRGRYFADAVVLRATPDPFYLIQDADDWSAPNRLAVLLERLRSTDHLGVVSAAQWWRQAPNGDGARSPIRRLTYEALDQPLTRSFAFRSDHHGLFRTEALRAIGGYYGGFRIGYDTLIMNLLMMLGPVGFVNETLYHRVIRSNSLTTSAATGMRSPRRSAVHDRLQTLYREAYARYRARGCDGDARAEALSRIATRHVADAERQALAMEAKRLRPRLLDAPTPRSGDVLTALRALVHHPALTWSREWAPMRDTAVALVQTLADERPQRILEAGSGNTTALFARYAQLTGAEVVTLEHDGDYRRATEQLLHRLDLRDAVDLRLAPLRPRPPHGAWYDTDLRAPFDFAFLDGPPKRHGRAASFPALHAVLSPEAAVWLHDGHRDHERACVDAWTSSLGCTARLDPTGKGIWVLTDGAAQDEPLAAR